MELYSIVKDENDYKYFINITETCEHVTRR